MNEGPLPLKFETSPNSTPEIKNIVPIAPVRKGGEGENCGSKTRSELWRFPQEVVNDGGEALKMFKTWSQLVKCFNVKVTVTQDSCSNQSNIKILQNKNRKFSPFGKEGTGKIHSVEPNSLLMIMAFHTKRVSHHWEIVKKQALRLIYKQSIELFFSNWAIFSFCTDSAWPSHFQIYISSRVFWSPLVISLPKFL